MDHISPQNTPFSDFSKDMFLKSKMKPVVVKYGVYLDILPRVSIYGTKCGIFQGTPKSGPIYHATLSESMVVGTRFGTIRGTIYCTKSNGSYLVLYFPQYIVLVRYQVIGTAGGASCGIKHGFKFNTYMWC